MKEGLKVGDIEHTCFGHVIVWSDGFLRNFNRQKDNSFWLFVAQMRPPSRQSTSEDHIFCLAFGQSSLNHDCVIEYYLNEIKTKLTPGKFRYYRKEGVRKMVNTNIRLGLVLGDIPEKNAMLHRLHLGLTGKRSQ